MSERPNPVQVSPHRVVRVVEEVRHTAPLGLRFRDAVLDVAVTTGLEVRARPQSGGAWTRAHESSQGIHGFVMLPTTRAAERQRVSEFGHHDPYVIEIVDRRGRFLTMRVGEDAPAALSASPILLFSRPDRPVPPGFGAVRATLRYEDTAIPAASGRRIRPAAHALATVTVAGVTHTGIADAGGELLVLVPLSQAAIGVPLHEQAVEAHLQVQFDPNLAHPSGSVPLIEDIVTQPVRMSHGPFPVGFVDDTVLTLPALASSG